MARPTASSLRLLLDRAAWSMIRHHIQGPRTGKGWAWPSSIQAPQVNTDRDVGAASVGMGFIAAYQTTGTRAFLQAAEEAADWLTLIAEMAHGGLHWPNSVAPSDPTSYTSFDDGAMGIADFLYRVYAIDRRAVYRRDAEAALRWEEAMAHGADGKPCPVMCSWQWDQDRGSGVYTGMGMGISGIAYTFDLFAQRTGNATDERYAEGAARYVEHLITKRHGVPEQPGKPGWDTGYLSGSAGDAFMFLSLYHHTRNRHWLRDAVRLLLIVQHEGHVSRDARVLADRNRSFRQAEQRRYRPGYRKGNAGIGWTMLNAYEITHRIQYLAIARRAGITSWRT